MITVIRIGSNRSEDKKELPISKLSRDQDELYRIVIKTDPSIRRYNSSYSFKEPCYIVRFDDKILCDTWSDHGIWINAFVNDILD